MGSERLRGQAVRNRIAKYFRPKRKSMRVECPYCHEARVTVFFEATEPALCPVCEARFTATPCDEGDARCRGHARVEASPELKQMMREWKDAHRALVLDQRQHPEDWTTCWRGDCAEGIEVVRGGPFNTLLPVGICDECEGTGKLRRS